MSTKKKEISKNRYSSILEFVTNKQYALAGVGISDKTSFDWRNKGIYLQGKKSNYRMKYSGVEYIWLLLVKELRTFGIPIKAIKYLKEFLITEVDVEALIVAFQDSNADSELVILQELTTKTDNSVQLKNEMKKSNEILEKHVVNSILTSMIISTLLKEKEYILFIKKNGDCLIETIDDDNSLSNIFLHESCLMIPFKNIVNQFLKNEKNNNYNKITQEFNPNF